MTTATMATGGSGGQVGGGVGAPPKPLLILQRTPGGATEIAYKNMRFLITERPNDLGMNAYVEELKKFNVAVVVRVCEATYDTEKLSRENIGVKDMGFGDGQAPPQEIIDSWLDLARTQFSTDPNSCIAVHCVAGLGRAPVLVALALMELGMKYEDAVELIRSKRRGAINAKQLSFLERYKPKNRLKTGKLNNNNNKECCIV